MKTSTPLLVKQLTRCTKEFNLGPIDIELKSGFTYGLLGANGSGKTTFMKCCMNLLKPSAGELRIFGETYTDTHERVKQHIAFVPVNLEGCEPFTLREMADLIRKGYSTWNEDAFLERARLFHISLDKPYGKQSEGERRKTALTLALGTRVPILLLDEPTNGLDIESRNRLKEMLLNDMDSMQRTVLMATHSLEDIRQFVDYIYVMKDGKIMGPFEKDELIASWGRIWLADDGKMSGQEMTKDQLQAIPGVIEWFEHPYPHMITRERSRTLAYLHEKQFEVVKEQPLAIDELLEYLLRL